MTVVGASTVLFDADLTKLLSAISVAKREVDALSKQGARVSLGGTTAPGALPSTAPAVAGLNALTQAEARAILTAQQLATEQQKTARTAQQLATDQQKTAQQIANTSIQNDKAALSALRLADAQRKLNQVPPPKPPPPPPPTQPIPQRAGLTPNQALGAFGLATFGPQLVGQAIGAGVQAGAAALALRETQNSLKAVSGDLQTYTKVLGIARQQQLQFGGSLQGNIEGLSGLTITARSSGAQLESLISLSQRLGVLDPSQGIAGARLALNEALSGSPLSLAARYEIPRQALEKLRDTTLPVEERLKVIDDHLNRVGITAASVTDKIDGDAAAFRRLNQELEDTKLTVGGGLATAFSGASTGLARLLGLVNNNPQAIAELKALLSGKGTVSEEDVAQVIKDRQTQAADASISRGSQGLLRAETFGTNAEGNAASQQGLDTLEQVRSAMIEVQGGTDAAKASAEELLRLYTFKKLPVVSLTAGLESLAARTRGVVDVEDARALRLESLNQGQSAFTRSMVALTQEMTKSAQASVLDAVQKDAQQAATALVAEQTRLAADAFLQLHPNIDAAGVASLVAAKKISESTGEYITMTLAIADARSKLAGLQQQAGIDAAKAPVRLGGIGGGQDRALELDGRGLNNADSVKAATARLKADTAERDALETARRNRILQTGTATQVVTLRQKEYNDAVKTYGVNSSKAIDAQTALIQAQEAATKAAKPKGGTKDPNAVGLGVLDQDTIKAGVTKQAQLDTVNRQLERTNLTEHQRNQLLEKRRKLEEDITNESEKQARASLDAQLDAVKDAQARLKETREAAGLERALAGGRISEEQRTAAQLRLQEIALEQQKRTLDIQKDQKVAGAATVDTKQAVAPAEPVGATQQAVAPAAVQPGARAITPQVPVPNVATLSPSTVNLALTLNIDKSGNVTAVPIDPNITLNLLGTAVNFRNLSGGTP